MQAIARQVGARLLTQDAEKKPDAGPKDTQAAADGAEGAEAGAAADNSVEGASGDGRPHGGSAARLASGGSGALAGADGGSLSLASPREHADTGASRIQALLQGMGPTDPTSSGVAGAGSTAVGGGSRVTLRPTLLPRASLTSADGEHTALGADGGDAYDPEAYNTAPLADPSTHGTAHDMPDYQPEYQPEQEDEAMVPEPEVLKDLAPIVVRAPEGSRAASLVPGDLVRGLWCRGLQSVGAWGLRLWGLCVEVRTGAKVSGLLQGLTAQVSVWSSSNSTQTVCVNARGSQSSASAYLSSQLSVLCCCSNVLLACMLHIRCSRPATLRLHACSLQQRFVRDTAAQGKASLLMWWAWRCSGQGNLLLSWLPCTCPVNHGRATGYMCGSVSPDLDVATTAPQLTGSSSEQN